MGLTGIAVCLLCSDYLLHVLRVVGLSEPAGPTDAATHPALTRRIEAATLAVLAEDLPSTARTCRAVVRTAALQDARRDGLAAREARQVARAAGDAEAKWQQAALIRARGPHGER